MSKVCVVVLPNIVLTEEDISELQSICKCCSFSLSTEISYYESFLDNYKNMNYTFFVLSDSNFNDLCEMFLLPDNCFVNGKTNLIPFRERMFQFQMVLRKLLVKVESLEVFIGDSGTAYNEFDYNQIHIEEFVHATDALNSVRPTDLHLTVKNVAQTSTGDGLRGTRGRFSCPLTLKHHKLCL